MLASTMKSYSTMDYKPQSGVQCSLQMAEVLLKDIYHHTVSRRSAALVSDDTVDVWRSPGMAKFNPNLNILHNSSFTHAMPAMLAEYTRGLIAHKLQLTGDACTYALTSHPLVESKSTPSRTAFFFAFFSAAFVLIPFCFVPYSGARFAVE